MAPLEPWEKVLVNADKLPDRGHTLMGCTGCHGGVQDPDKDTAHIGVVRDPSSNPEAACSQCHPDQVAHNQGSLHNSLAGYWTALDERSIPGGVPDVATLLDAAYSDFLANMVKYNTIGLDDLNLALGEEPPPYLLHVRQPNEPEEKGHIERLLDPTA